MEVDFTDNPHLRLPSPTVDSASLLKWLKTGGDYEEANSVKLLILGHGGAGKTTLLRSLQEMTNSGSGSGASTDEGEDEFDDGDLWDRFWFRSMWTTNANVFDNTSTIGLNPAALALSERLKFTVCDFAGQMEYLSVHQFFLSAQSAVYIMVTDLSLGVEQQKARLEYWIGLLRSRLPIRDSFKLIFVGTKIDLVPNQEVLRQRKASIEAFIQAQPFSAVRDLQIVCNTDMRGIQDLVRTVRRIATLLMSQEVRKPLMPLCNWCVDYTIWGQTNSIAGASANPSVLQLGEEGHPAE